MTVAEALLIGAVGGGLVGWLLGMAMMAAWAQRTRPWEDE